MAYRDGAVIPPAGYEVAHSTKTLKFFRKKDDPTKVLLGVRGTRDFRDIAADAALAVGALKESRRYAEDRETMRRFVRENPGVRISTAGHSLGGAVARELAREFPSNVVGGTGFNSAIGLDELDATRLRAGKQQRVSTRADFLRLLTAPFLQKRDQARVVDVGLSGWNPLTAHGIKRFDATGAGV